MQKVNYNDIYLNYPNGYVEWIKNICFWKAEKLCQLIDADKPRNSILEIGSGRGDALDAMGCFKTKIGADISEEALKQHHEIYPDHKLVKIDADKNLPFADKEIDCVLLCDILEHVGKPEELLREAGRVGKYLLLKIPVEKAFFIRLMHKIKGVKYGVTHPSGHLYCWGVKDIKLLLANSNIKEIKAELIPNSIDLLYKKFWLKTAIYKICLFFDNLFNTTFLNRNILGLSYFAIAERE